MREGTAFVQNGVRFDGYDSSAGLLIEAKSGMGFMVKDGEFRDWARLSEKLLEQAGRQIKAADGARIEWRFSSESVANAVSTLFSDAGINIGVKYVP